MFLTWHSYGASSIGKGGWITTTLPVRFRLAFHPSAWRRMMTRRRSAIRMVLCWQSIDASWMNLFLPKFSLSMLG